jgi:hypothetical protein
MKAMKTGAAFSIFLDSLLDIISDTEFSERHLICNMKVLDVLTGIF